MQGTVKATLYESTRYGALAWLTVMALASQAAAQTIVVDNTDVGFSVLAEAWGTASAAGQYGSDYRYRSTTQAPGEVEWRPNFPVAGAPVQILTASGQILAQGTTDDTGLFTPQLEPRDDLYESVYAILHQPGNELFSMAKSDWDQGISGWDFGYNLYLDSSPIKAYIYTDRPIYRPGQTVHFRVVAREAFNGRYQMPDFSQVEIVLRDDRGEELQTMVLPLNEFGTANASYALDEEAQPGYYGISASGETYMGGVTFQVSEYRKPEVDLSVDLLEQRVRACCETARRGRLRSCGEARVRLP